MNKDRHTDLTLIYFKSPTLEVGVVVIKTGIDPLYGTEYTTLLWLAFIAATRAHLIVVNVVKQATTVTAVKAGTGEVTTVLDVRGASEPNLPILIKRLECRDNSLPLTFDESPVANQLSHTLKRVLQVRLQAGLVRLGQALSDLFAQRFAVGQALDHELIPEIKRDRDGRVGRVFRDVFAQQIELGRLAADILSVAWFHRLDRLGVDAGSFLGFKFQRRRSLQLGHGVEHRLRKIVLQLNHSGRVVWGLVDASACLGSKHHHSSVQRAQTLASRLVSLEVKWHTEIFRKDRNVRVWRGRVQRNDAGHARNLRRDMIRQKDVVARQITRPKRRGNLTAFDKNQAAHCPTLRVNHIRACLPSMRRHHRYIDRRQRALHFAVGIGLLVGWHVQPAQRGRFFDGIVHLLPKEPYHRCRQPILPHELDCVLAIFLGIQYRPHHSPATGVEERDAVELHVRHVIELRHKLGSEVVVEFQPLAVLKINRREIVHQHCEFCPLRFLRFLRPGRCPAALGSLEFHHEIVLRERQLRFPVRRAAELGGCGLEKLKIPLPGSGSLAITKRQLVGGRHREPVGKVIRKQ